MEGWSSDYADVACASAWRLPANGAVRSLSTPSVPSLFLAPRLDNEGNPCAFCVYIHMHTNVLNAPPRESAIKRHDACASTRGTVWRAFELPPPYFSNGKQHGFETRIAATSRATAPVLLSFYSSSFAMQPDGTRKIGLTNRDIPVESGKCRSVMRISDKYPSVNLRESPDILCPDFRMTFEI